MDDTMTITDTNLAAVQRLYAAYGRGDLAAVLDELADDVDWAAEAASRSVPWYGEFRGKSAVPGRAGRGKNGGGSSSPGVIGVGAHASGGLDVAEMPRAQLADLILQLNEQMLGAARELQFEVAARLRDEISELKKELRGMDAAR